MQAMMQDEAATAADNASTHAAGKASLVVAKDFDAVRCT